MENDEFRIELQQLVTRRAVSTSLVDTLAFVTEVSERLADDPAFGEFNLVEYIGTGIRGRNLRIHGYTSFDESDGTIGLVVAKWTDNSESETLLKDSVLQMADGLRFFAEEAFSNSLNERIMESNPAYELATFLQNYVGKISRLRLHIFSNQTLSTKFKEELLAPIANIQVEQHIWDCKRLKSLYESQRERESVEINFSQMGNHGIACIEAARTDDLRSFLCVIDGQLLADLFDRWGSRLLEGNVRSFLGMKGGVNKGIKSTIRDTPDLFFAYNNGIAATAAQIVVSNHNGQPFITEIKDLQIVNGGQTTASILNTRKKDGISLRGVAVPMKLTEVSDSQAHDLIPRIAQYANTQNKIAAADFFANHPFHTKMEEISRRLTVPAQPGKRILSKWFYERSRGQYHNERLYLTSSQKTAFDLQFPSDQVINKTDLAKLDSVRNLRPHWVSLGAQKNFIKFADRFSTNIQDKLDSEYWSEISPDFGDAYFQDIVSMAILWSATEKLVSNAKGDWYEGGYRPQIVAYTLALMFDRSNAEGQIIDLRKIWQRQGAPVELLAWIRDSAPIVQKTLLAPATGTTNVGEWAKKEDCWKQMKSLPLPSTASLDGYLMEKSEGKTRAKDDRKQGQCDDAISLQTEVLTLTQSHFWSILSLWKRLPDFTIPSERELITKASTVAGFSKITRGRDWKKLLELKDRCEIEGFKV